MTTDRFVIRAVVVFLGVTILMGMGLGGYLANDGKSVPDFIIATTSGAIGALGALLARTSDGPAPTPVEVVNTGAGEAVPVTQTPAPTKARGAKKT